MTTAYANLQSHLQTHKYLRGQFKGDAPADHHRRERKHIRVVQRSGAMAVRMHYTDILTAYPDGRVVVDCGGWSSSPTTRDALHHALARFCTGSLRFAGIRSNHKHGLNQPILNGHVYYDGMEFDESGALLSPQRPLMRKRINREESKALQAGVRASGFREAYRVLQGTVQTYNLRAYAITPEMLRWYITDPDNYGHMWPDVTCAFPSWTALWERATEDMYETVPA